MAFPNWYEMVQVARDGHAKYSTVRTIAPASRKRRHSSGGPSQLPRARWFALTVILFLSVTTLYSASASRLAADTSHQSSTPSTTPPPTAPRPLFDSSLTSFVVVNPSSVPVGAVGSTFTVQIKVQNMPQFNGWDIQVYAAPWILNATNLSISGNDFAVNASSGTAFEIVHCLNGKGTGCTSADNPGYVHSAFGDTGVVSGGGLLFTVTYQVIGNAGISQSWYGYSPISPLNVGISSPSSADGDAATAISGSYGTYVALGDGGGAKVPMRD